MDGGNEFSSAVKLGIDECLLNTLNIYILKFSFII